MVSQATVHVLVAFVATTPLTAAPSLGFSPEATSFTEFLVAGGRHLRRSTALVVAGLLSFMQPATTSPLHGRCGRHAVRACQGATR
jgi:hypothetical protein